MVYVMTGLNGDYQKYLELKESILLKQKDDLFILGGILGEKGGIDILLDMLQDGNIFPITGKQELSALKFLNCMQNKDKIENNQIKLEMTEWLRNGGMPIANGFMSLDDEKKEMIIDYLQNDFTLFEELDVDGNLFVLSYAGLGDFDPDRELDEYTTEDLTAGDYTPNCYFDEKSIICGNLVDFEPDEDGYEDRIYKSENVFVMNHTLNTKPCCIRLNDLQEYYVD